MRRHFKSFLLFIFLAGCIEPYDFVVRNTAPGIAIEAHLSDKSFHDTQLYPSDGRYPSVRLTRTSDVENVRAEPISGAQVELVDDQGGMYQYAESETPGLYLFTDADFKATPGFKYKLLLLGTSHLSGKWPHDGICFARI